MKKNVILKTIINLVLLITIAFLCYWIYHCVDVIKYLSHYINTFGSQKYEPTRNIYVICLIFSIVQTILNIFIFIHFNVKELPFVKILIFKTYAENKERIKEEKKEKKQAKLEAEIAEKQAMLDEMKKE